MLEKMLEMQRELQVKHYGAAPDTLEGEERIQFVKDMHIALTDELHEALAEVSWKPWAKAEYFNEAAYKGELVDAFHFFMNLMMAGHITADDLFEGYVKKNALNAKRQIEGYDGVSTKCPGCGRALDDEAVQCTENECSVTAMTHAEKAEAYAQVYGKHGGAVIAPAGTPLEAMIPFFDPTKPMRRTSGRVNDPGPAINVVVNAITPEVINRSARGLPNLFDRRNFQ